jgi:hypothetical protein
MIVPAHKWHGFERLMLKEHCLLLQKPMPMPNNSLQPTGFAGG